MFVTTFTECNAKCLDMRSSDVTSCSEGLALQCTLDMKSIWELSFHKIANCMPIQISYMPPKHVDYLDMILRSLTDPEDIPV